MKLIKQSYEFVPQALGLEGIYKQIEKAGRICYKSEDKITEDSAKRFVDNLIKSGHGSVLEHGTLYFKIPANIDVAGNFLDEVPTWTKCKLVESQEGNWWAITTNLRVMIEHFAPEYTEELIEKYLCEPTEYHEKRITVKFITGIDISRETNRHRVNSISEESTRYCNYSLGKFGSSINIALNTDIDEQDVIDCVETWDSCWDDNRLNEDRLFRTMCLKIGNNKDDLFGIVDTWFFANLACEWAYKKLISLGWKAQQARRVLPLDTQTELVHTAFISDWKHFLSLRSPKYGATGVHPDAAYLADELYDLLQIGG
jgi:thymidylate synthase (FAD)